MVKQNQSNKCEQNPDIAQIARNAIFFWLFFCIYVTMLLPNYRSTGNSARTTGERL
jgi:hypothetical protein